MNKAELIRSLRGKPRFAVVGSSLAIVAAGVSGCGIGDSSQAADANQPSASNQQGQGQGQGARPQLSSDQKAQLKKFRDCMKQHGVDVPDFSNGPPEGGPPAGFDPTSSKFRSAIQACGQYAPQGGPPGGAGGPPGGGGPPGMGDSQGGSSQGGAGGGATGPPGGYGQSSQ